MLTEVIEDYLKAIYEIQTESGKVTTTSLSKRMNIAPASATGMIKKLSEMKLVTYTPYQGLKLTDAGNKIALEVIRHHRLIELFLAEALGIPWDRVHEEAEKWEHVLSEYLESRIDELLGYPTFDPHGAPIPTRSGKIPKIARIRLSDLKPGQSAVVKEVSDHNSELLRYVGDMGIYPNVKIYIQDVAPFDGPIQIKIGNESHLIGRKAAQFIFMNEVKAEGNSLQP